MKRITAIVLAALAAVLLAACAGKSRGNATSDTQELESIFQTVCSAGDALELARKSDLPVFETEGCTSGKDTWDAFFRTASGGVPASVLCAHYYVLDKAHMSAELYEAEKDQYPKLFFYLVEFDGTKYSVKTRESTEAALDSQEDFKYLLHFTGDAPSTALYSSYDCYVLVDDPSATWDGILAGEFSSQAGAGYKHCTVYSDLIGWNGG